MRRSEQRMLWLLRLATRWGPDSLSYGFLVAWDQEDAMAFLKAFPEAEKATRWYLMGAPSIPMLNAAAGRAKRLGYLRPGSVGTTDARAYNRRTWCRTWSVTPSGYEFLAAMPAKAGEIGGLRSRQLKALDYTDLAV